MDFLINKIKDLLKIKPNPIIAIDGMCASGKTTLAAVLSEQFGMQVIHMDDFFLPFEMRTDERLSQIGGNIHYERFTEEVVIPIKANKAFEYRIFSCSSGEFCIAETVNPEKPIIIEGAYSMHPEIPGIYDLKIFSQISSEKQLERIEKRNGAIALQMFEEKWIPFENSYFEAFQIKEKCDHIITNGLHSLL